MEPRHLKLLGLFFMLTFFCIFVGLYIFAYSWITLINAGLLFFAFLIPPTCCYGYNSVDDAMYSLRDHSSGVSEDSYKNLRDCGYVTSGVAYLLTYVIPVVFWAQMKTTMWNVIVIDVANMFVAFSFIIWIRVFL